MAILWSCCLQNENLTQITREKKERLWTQTCYLSDCFSNICLYVTEQVENLAHNTHTLFFFRMVMIIIPCATYILLNEPSSLVCVRHLEICTDDVAKMLELRYHQFHLFLCKLSMQIGDRFHL